MIRMERKFLVGVLSLLLVFSCSLPGLCSERIGQNAYTITEEELNQLDNNLNRLQTTNEESQQELKALRKELAKSKNELAEAKNALQEQTLELNRLKADSMKQENLLDNANRLLIQYEQEEKRTRLRIKAQRNAWECASLILAVAGIVK